MPLGQGEHEAMVPTEEEGKIVLELLTEVEQEGEVEGVGEVTELEEEQDEEEVKTCNKCTCISRNYIQSFRLQGAQVYTSYLLVRLHYIYLLGSGEQTLIYGT